MKIKHLLRRLRCRRCEWEWVPRIADPAQCPKCKSAYWNQERPPVSPENARPAARAQDDPTRLNR